VSRASTGGDDGEVLGFRGRGTAARSVADKPPPVIAPSILKHYPDLNDAQKEIVGHRPAQRVVVPPCQGSHGAYNLAR
jgi:hypothetical protein